eukprot:scaffold65863_cov66-Phaeocystis_antarctica.AAC.7
MERSVLGCRLPRVSRCTSSASRYSGSAAARSPLVRNNAPRLPMVASVSRCRLPRVSRCTSSASRYSGSAAARSPFAFNSRPRLMMVMSVSRCRLPRVSRCTSSASWYSGSAVARSPLAYNSEPTLFMERSVIGCRLPSVSRRTSSASRSNGSAAARSPLPFNSAPSLLMELSVRGWRLPRVSRRPSNASRSSSSAAAKSPLAYNSTPRLLVDASVLGCRLPRVSRFTSNASRYSGSASSYLPWTCSSLASLSRVHGRVRRPPVGARASFGGAVRQVVWQVRSAWSRARRSSRLNASRGRLRPRLGSRAAIAPSSVRGSTWRCHGTHTAARAGHRLLPPSNAGTSSPPPPPLTLWVKALCECDCALCPAQAVLEWNRAARRGRAAASVRAGAAPSGARKASARSRRTLRGRSHQKLGHGATGCRSRRGASRAGLPVTSSARPNRVVSSERLRDTARLGLASAARVVHSERYTPAAARPLTIACPPRCVRGHGGSRAAPGRLQGGSRARCDAPASRSSSSGSAQPAGRATDGRAQTAGREGGPARRGTSHKARGCERWHEVA